jgi:Tol biopolymer transport system component
MTPIKSFTKPGFVISWRPWQVTLAIVGAVSYVASTDWHVRGAASHQDQPYAQISRDDHDTAVWSIAISKSAGLASSSSTELRLKNLATGQVVQLLDHRESFGQPPAFSPDGRTLAVISSGAMIRFWDTQTLMELEEITLSKGVARTVAFSPDGTILAVAVSRSRQVTLYTWPGRRQLGVLAGSGGEINLLAFSPDGKKLVTADSSSQVTVCDVASRREIAHWLAHPAGISALALSPDGRLIASASFLDNAVRLWGLADGKSQGSLASANRGMTGLAFSPDATKLALSRTDGAAALWDLVSRQQIGEVKVGTGSLQSIAFSPDGRMLATGGVDGAVRYWDVTMMEAGGARKP